LDGKQPLQVLAIHGSHDERGREQREDTELAPEPGEVVVLQCVVEAVVPAAEQHVDPDGAQRQGDHRHEQDPRTAFAGCAPERLGERPSIGKRTPR